MNRTGHIFVSAVLTMLVGVLIGCKDDVGPAPNAADPVPPATWEQPFTITCPTESVLIIQRSPLTIRWKLRDTSLTTVMLHVRPVNEARWKFIAFTPAKAREYSVDMKNFKFRSFKLAISTTYQEHWDSTSVIAVNYLPVKLVVPTDGSILVDPADKYFKWEVHDAGVEVVQIQWSIFGGPWEFGFLRLAADSSYHWSSVPFGTGQCVDFRIRAYDWSDWSYIRNVAFAEFDLKSPKAGDILHRWMPLKITSVVKIPCKKNEGTLSYELSLDGGQTWSATEHGRAITTGATNNAMLRMSHSGTGWQRINGPFLIEDRSSEYFSLSVGRTLKYYVFGIKGSSGGSDTTSRSWHTITVLRERPGSGRTEFECSILVEAPDGSSSLKTGLLWQQYDGRKMISGDFEPFTNVEVYGIHDSSVDLLKTRIVHGTPPQLPISFTYYETRRGRGIVSKDYSTTETRIPPSGYGTSYRLLE